jgi:hypothetical protein
MTDDTPEPEERTAAASQRPRWKRELYWFLILFAIPFLLLHSIDLLPHDRGAPWWKRLLMLEDACAYAFCLLIPAAIYVVSRVAMLFARR